jgi:hypothetical protein
MTEEILANSTDTPSTLHIMKESVPVETHHVNSLIRPSSSNKLNVLATAPSPTMTTNSTSTSMCCIETDSIAQSITDTSISIAATPIDEDHILNGDIIRQGLLLVVEKHTSLNDSDNDSFDDEDEAIVTDSIYSSLSSTPTSYAIMSCPICFESLMLESSSCCTFRCCVSCWRTHISTTINDGRIKISCVSNECNKYLTRESIVNFIRYDSVLHERYLKLYANANQNPRAKTCK